jgi:hypothetical protein
LVKYAFRLLGDQTNIDTPMGYGGKLES